MLEYEAYYTSVAVGHVGIRWIGAARAVLHCTCFGCTEWFASFEQQGTARFCVVVLGGLAGSISQGLRSLHHSQPTQTLNKNERCLDAN